MIQIDITLYKSYFYGAVLNIPVKYDDDFSHLNNSVIDVYFGEWTNNPIKAKIDRNANYNHPRIRSVGANRTIWIDWIKANHKLNDKIKVSFDSPDYKNSILIQ